MPVLYPPWTPPWKLHKKLIAIVVHCTYSHLRDTKGDFNKYATERGACRRNADTIKYLLMNCFQMSYTLYEIEIKGLEHTQYGNHAFREGGAWAIFDKPLGDQRRERRCVTAPKLNKDGA